MLIADEPTTALDASLRLQMLQLLADLQQKTGMAVLLITHDLALVRHFAHQVAVMEMFARRAARRRAAGVRAHSGPGYHGALALIWAAVRPRETDRARLLVFALPCFSILARVWSKTKVHVWQKFRSIRLIRNFAKILTHFTTSYASSIPFISRR